MSISKLIRMLGLSALIAILSACGNDSGSEVELTSESSKSGIPFPAALQANSLPKDGTLKAYISCGAGDKRMPVNEIDLAGGVVKATCIGLALGEHTFRIEFEFESNKYGNITLANADKSFEVIEGDNNLSFLENDYQYDDNDNDGIINVWELANGLDPLDAGDATADLDEDAMDNLAEYKAGTFPNKPDSDNDGVNDGAEITAGRNPLVNEPAILSIIQMLLLDS